jgi:uncharacterized protein YijF (DUF1287 family)
MHASANGFALRQSEAEPGTHRLFLERLSSAAIKRTQHQVRYDPAYVRIPYPDGDVPADTGLCTDEVIRAYRTPGIDPQKKFHEDIVRDTMAYPLHSHPGIARPDTNIDRRRVPNLEWFSLA